MADSLEGKVALVTGGGTGIGKAVSLALAGRGYSIAVNYSKSALEAEEVAASIRAFGGKALAMRANVGEVDEVRAMLARVMDAFGRLDCLVCNAGTTHFVDYPDLDKLTDSVWQDIFQTNVMGTFFCIRESVAEIRKNSGAIVLVTSVAGITGMGSSIPYAVSKGALNTMTKALARTFGPAVRINAVAPGPVLTRWLSGHQDRVKDYLAQAPLGKACTPEDVADAVVYLAVETKLTTGQILVVDGGRTM